MQGSTDPSMTPNPGPTDSVRTHFRLLLIRSPGHSFTSLQAAVVSTKLVEGAIAHHDSAQGAQLLRVAVSSAACANSSLQTMVNCIDNSGAAIVECVKVLKQKRHARIGISFHRH